MLGAQNSKLSKSNISRDSFGGSLFDQFIAYIKSYYLLNISLNLQGHYYNPSNLILISISG